MFKFYNAGQNVSELSSFLNLEDRPIPWQHYPPVSVTSSHELLLSLVIWLMLLMLLIDSLFFRFYLLRK